MLRAKRMLTAKAVALVRLLAAAAAQEALPVTTVEVVVLSLLPGMGIDGDKVPSNAQSLQTLQITTQGPTSFTTPVRFVAYSEVESCCKHSLIIWTTA